MKLLSKRVAKNEEGSVTLCPEQLEDMWHVYNLLTPGDFLKATTIR
jgi:protein pelota